MKSLLQHHSFLIIAAALTIIMVGVSMYFSLNIPRYDDFDQVLGWLLQQQDAQSAVEKLRLLLQERNEHRAFFIHLLAWLDQSIFGQVNFKRLIFYTNLMYLAFIYVIYLIADKLQVTRIQLIPVLLFLVIPNFILLNWNTAGLIYISSILCSCVSLYFLSSGNSKGLALAIVFAVLSTMNFTSGFLTFIAGIPFFIKTYSRRGALIWLVAFLATIFLYRYGYEPAVRNDPVTAMIELPHVIVINFLVFFGGPFKSLFTGHFSWHFGVGLLAIMTTGYLIIRHFRTLLREPLLCSGIIFGLGLGGGIALMRAENGLGSSTAFRYEMFQSILIIFLYFALIRCGFIRKSLLHWIIGLSTFFYGLRLEDQLMEYRDNYKKMTYGLYAYQQTGDPSFLPVKKTGASHRIIREARRWEIYDYRSIECTPEVVPDVHQIVESREVRFVRYREKEGDSYYFLSGWAFLKFKYNKNIDIYLKLDSGKEVYYWPTSYLVGKKAHSQKADSGFMVVLDKYSDQLPAGTYSGSLVLHHPINGIMGSVEINREFEIY